MMEQNIHRMSLQSWQRRISAYVDVYRIAEKTVTLSLQFQQATHKSTLRLSLY